MAHRSALRSALLSVNLIGSPINDANRLIGPPITLQSTVHSPSRNNEVQFTGTFGERGVRYTLQLKAGDAEGRSRQVVKSDSATVRVPELDFEIPAATQKGTISTVEGLLSDAASNLRCASPSLASSLRP